MLLPAERDWPQLRIVRSTDESALAEERITDERADVRLRAGGRVEIERRTGTAHFVVPRVMSDAEAIHPGLAPVAVVMAHWLDRPCFHAGAFVTRGGAWAVAGARESGKSSTLASLALRGHPLLTDDILVLDGSGAAFAGPRCIDLREDAAEALAAGKALGRVGTRERWRVLAAPVPNSVPFRGWFFLGWGAELERTQLGGADVLALLFEQHAARIAPRSPASLLDLAGLPAWLIQRPRDHRTLEQTVEMLVEIAQAE
jgi:hypothetical protein